MYADRDTFYSALAAFTADEANVRFVPDIVYNDDGEIQASANGPNGHGRGASSRLLAIVAAQPL